MKPLFVVKSVGFLFLCHASTVLAENVCENKHWLQSPVVALASDNDAGIGGTGFAQPLKSPLIATLNGEGESGIGGTGLTPLNERPLFAQSNNDGSGIGGTGIVGIISGFGSICVNGIEIHFNEATTITEDGQPSTSNRLALGQTVSVLAHSDTENYYAHEIRVLNEVKGEVNAVDIVNNTFSVLGQTVHLPAEALEKIAVGDSVTVSGNRLNDGHIDAMRVEKSDQHITQFSLTGPLEKDAASGQFYIGKQSISPPAQIASLQIGDEVRIQGTLKENVLQVDALEQNPRWAFSSNVERLLVQGHVREGSDTLLNIDGLRVKVDNTDAKTPKTGQYVGVWVQPLGHGAMVLHHLQTNTPALEHNHHGNHLDEHARAAPSTLREERIEHEVKNAAIERLEIGHHDIEKHEMNKPDILRPEIEKYDMTRPELSRPDINRIDIDKPTLLRLEANRPEVQRIEKPVLLHLNIERPEIHTPRR